MDTPKTHHPKVFISYSHDSPEHITRVREFSDCLREDGIRCILDQYEVSPPEGWPRWMDRHIRDADFVLVICTEAYYRRVMGEEKAGIGLGVRWEGNLIYQHISNAETLNIKFIPVLLESGEFSHIPTPLQGVNYYFAGTREGYDELYRHLTNQPRHRKPVTGKLRELPPLERRQDSFAAQLTNLRVERNPFFTGREELLKELRQEFTKKKAMSLTQAISGLGGLGKTQTAIEYAYRYRDVYKAVFWVRADSHLALSAGFVEIARLLNLPEKDAQSPDDAVRAVRRWLENNSDWFLVFDNADTPALLKGFRPHGAKGHILLTSRAQVFDTLGVAKPVEIEAMSAEEALQFLFARTARGDEKVPEREAAAQLALELGHLPLALEQAGAFITAKKVRFQDYLAGYRKRRLELLKESAPITGDYPESVATTWAINFREVEKVSVAASDLLRASTCLSPDRIPLELITKGRSELGPALSAALADVNDEPFALNRVLEPLTRFSFIRFDTDSQSYNVHRLVQEVLRDGMDANTQRVWAERTIRTLDDAFPNVEFSNWPLCERLLPHAKVAAKLIEKWNIISKEAARLLNEAAYYSYERGQYADAEPLYQRSLAIREKALGPDHPEVARSLNNLALLYKEQGKYPETEPLYRRSLAIREKALGPDHLDVARSLNNLAELYRVQGKYAIAEPLHKRSLAIKERGLEPDHPDLASSLNNLAALYRRQGKYTEAEPLYTRALRIREKALGPEHPAVARSLNNLAALYHVQGRYAEAEPLLLRSLTIREKTLGPDHPDTAEVLNNVASLYYEQSKFIDAEPLYERSLSIRKNALGQDHPDIAQSFNNLAEVYRAQGKYTEAEPLYKRAMAILERTVGPNHPDVASVAENYSALLRATEREAEAGELEGRVVAIRAMFAQDSVD